MTSIYCAELRINKSILNYLLKKNILYRVQCMLDEWLGYTALKFGG